MGGLVRINYLGSDGIKGTSDDKEYLFYLTSDAIKIYQDAGANITVLNDIDDSVVTVFNLSRYATRQEGATYQELLDYFRGLGFSDEQAVSKAQSMIGITKEEMIRLNDSFQTEIMREKQAVIDTNAKMIYDQTHDETFEEISLYPATAKLTQTMEPQLSNSVTNAPETQSTIFQPKLSVSISNASYLGGIVKGKCIIKRNFDQPLIGGTLHITLKSASDNRVLRLTQTPVQTKDGTIEFNYSIGYRITQNVIISAFVLANDGSTLSNTARITVSWTADPSQIKKVVKPTKSVEQILTDNWIYIVGGVGVLGLVAFFATRKKKIEVKV